MSNMTEKKSRLLLAQVDNVTGETLGFAVEKLMELGARNIQVIPAITKKNRPGSILLIDTDLSKEKNISDFLVRELKLSGYHRIDTSHVFQKITFAKKKLCLKVNGEKNFIECEIKITGDPSNPISVGVEHSALVRAQKNLQDKVGALISLSEIESAILSKFGRTICIESPLKQQ